MATQWQTFPVEFRGGLLSNMSLLQQGTGAVGSASILQNFEVNKEGGYSKIRGFEKFSSSEIPGSDAVLGLKVVSSGRMIAARKLDADAVTEFQTATADVNGAISATTALVLDNNDGTIEEGMYVTGTGISGSVTVATVTDQNNIVLSSAQTLADDTTLTFGTFASTDVGKTAYYYSTGTNWNHTALSANTNGGKVRHVTYNFDGTERTIFVDGVNYPSIYDLQANTQTFLSASSTNINTDVEGADFVTIFKRTGFFAKGNLLLFTAPFTVDNFSVADGAGSISLAEDITGLAVFREQLIVFTTDTISRLTGSSSADFRLDPITEKIGCINGDTIQEVGGDIMYLSPDGIRQLSATDRIGDFALDVASDRIKEDANDFLGGTTQFASVLLRGKSQYRIFAFKTSQRPASSKGLIATKINTQGSSGIEWSTTMGIKAYVADSVYANNTETIGFAHTDGYAYEMDTGSSFGEADGVGIPIEAIFESAYMPINDPQVRKTFYKTTWFINPEGSIDLDFNVKFDFESKSRNNVVQPETINIATAAAGIALFGAGAVFGATIPPAGTFGGTLEKIYPTNVIGSGKTVALRITDISTNPTFTLDTAVLEYKTNDRQ